MKINRKKVALLVFFWITLLLIVTNPAVQWLNVSYSSSEATATLPSGMNDGFQGSSYVSYSAIPEMLTNSTSGQKVEGYEVTISVFNIGSVLLLTLPFVAFAYSELSDQEREQRERRRASPPPPRDD